LVNPFSEEKISNTEFIRCFSSNIEVSELKWHQDWEDRTIQFLESSDWMFQFDDELPIPCEGELYIKAGTWHRVIKGTGNLKIRIIKHVSS
jgi:hypothetical protein